MNKEQFLQKLKEQLITLSPAELEKTLAFYDESINDRMEDGMTEEQAVQSLGDILQIANNILLETPLASLIHSRIKQSRSDTKNKTLWMVLAICGFPLWLPLALAFALCIVAVYACIWAVVICLLAVAACIALSGALGLVGGVVMCFTSSWTSGIAAIGTSIALIGLFIMLIKPLLWLCRQFITLTGRFLRFVKSRFISPSSHTGTLSNDSTATQQKGI